MRSAGRRVTAAGALIAVAGAVVAFCAPGAFASSFVQPSGSRLVVPAGGGVAPAPVTVEATGFAPGALVYVEQCDGVAPSAPQWSPTADCDLGSSPAPAIADAHGVATFAATDRNRAFRPFAGESPQSMFNCLIPGQGAPANALKSFSNCSLRVSTNNAAVPADQAFLAIELTATVPPPSTSTTAPTPAKTTTTARAHTAGSVPKRGSKAHASKSKKTATKHAPKTVAVVPPASAASGSGTSGGHTTTRGSGVLALSDSRVATGYVLLLGGLALAVLTISLRRRSSELLERGDAYADAG